VSGVFGALVKLEDLLELEDLLAPEDLLGLEDLLEPERLLGLVCLGELELVHLHLQLEALGGSCSNWPDWGPISRLKLSPELGFDLDLSPRCLERPRCWKSSECLKYLHYLKFSHCS
jgi:hypothetical protein